MGDIQEQNIGVVLLPQLVRDAINAKNFKPTYASRSLSSEVQMRAEGYHINISSKEYTTQHLLPILLLTILPLPSTRGGALLFLLRAPWRATRCSTHKIIARIAVGDGFFVVGASRLGS